MTRVARLLAVTAIVKANADANTVTDIYQLAEQLQKQFPDYCKKELVTIIEQAVVELRGAAIWEKR